MEKLSLSRLIDTLGEMLLERPDSSVVRYFRRDDNTAIRLVLRDGREFIIDNRGNVSLVDPNSKEGCGSICLGKDPAEWFPGTSEWMKGVE